jgi:hypothetical protein
MFAFQNHEEVFFPSLWDTFIKKELIHAKNAHLTGFIQLFPLLSLSTTRPIRAFDGHGPYDCPSRFYLSPADSPPTPFGSSTTLGGWAAFTGISGGVDQCRKGII